METKSYSIVYKQPLVLLQSRAVIYDPTPFPMEKLLDYFWFFIIKQCANM